jgi:tetratricopeptide (TPR) repeat protein
MAMFSLIIMAHSLITVPAVSEAFLSFNDPTIEGLPFELPRIFRNCLSLKSRLFHFLFLLQGLLLMNPTYALDLQALWDFSNPELSEQRFREALKEADGDNRLILQTQIARSFGLRLKFQEARSLLLSLEADLTRAGPEVKVRYFLELGRTYASAKHTKEQLTAQAKEKARSAFNDALALSKQHQLDGLTIDAIHMFAFIDTKPEEQLGWAQAALKVAKASKQAEATRWESSIQNNIGYALNQMGRFQEAQAALEAALLLRQQTGRPEQVFVARWMVAWNLRALGRIDEALQIQLALEQEAELLGKSDQYVFEELAALFKAKDDLKKAEYYAGKLSELRKR